jgi:predicted aspartyl protease
MTGLVDCSGRALLQVRLRHPTSAIESVVDCWIDTGFTGELVMPRQKILELGLPPGIAVRAGLADGTEVDLDTYTCMLNWFGEWKRIEVLAGGGQFPLLGVGL